VKKTLFIFVLMAAMFIMVAGCAPSTVVQVNTPVPKATAGTPAPNGQINVPGVSIQVYAPGPNPMVNTPDEHGAPATIWLGIWHGIISPVIIVLSFLHKNVQTYEVHNDGSLYNLGFFLGVFLLWAVVIGLLTGRR
jgi:NADH dehydrogenase FAD-containing subunit